MGSLNGTKNVVLPTQNAQVVVLSPNKQLLCAMTVLRDQETETPAFVSAFQLVAHQLMTAALDLVPTESLVVITPTKSVYRGMRPTRRVCGISILRAGASMEDSLRQSYSGPLSFGKILIQRDEETCLPTHLYSKFPKDIANRFVLILEPMLATGGSASKAIDLILEAGVPEQDIVFVNVMASRKGIEVLTRQFPRLKIVTAAVDDDLTASGHIAPGLGDFGDRYYGTAD
ncbi:uracil phosphoribosyltransferase [Capronia coronata CBS 617.96]|uniref:uracil phosphoribosyltransferase n=1 Tax=Capronia coronata CBS 617.96 TaxID=1182541 RepID=W9YC84_9EURO|nr:uracil phosphoribosyltransferase [Capronia coronata CBS 617.96]EXJ90482.1 uracil phosphoribosyltransferase [Capronia coronata CBS 617.96]